MVTVQEVKDYLQIPYCKDDKLIQDILDTGYGYLEDAVDNFKDFYATREKFAKKADAWVLTQWVPTFYDQREGMLANSGTELNYGARSMLMQLQYEV